MENAANVNQDGKTSIINDSFQDSSSEPFAVSIALPFTRHKDFPGFSNACKILNGSIFKDGTMEDDNTSTKESPTRKDNAIEVPERLHPATELINDAFKNYQSEVLAVSITTSGTYSEDRDGFSKGGTTGKDNISPRESAPRKDNSREALEGMSLGTKHTTLCDFYYKTEETTEGFINTEDEAHRSSYNVQHIQERQIFTPSLPKKVNNDRAVENQTEIHQCQQRSSEVKTGTRVEDSCLQTRHVCNQASTAEIPLDLSQEPLAGCRKLTFPVDPASDDENRKDANCTAGSKPVFDLVFSDIDGNILNAAPQSQMRHLQNCDNRSLKVVCPPRQDGGEFSDICKQTDGSAVSTATKNLYAVFKEKDKYYITSEPNICASSMEAGKISITPTKKVENCSVQVETNSISTIPSQKISIGSVVRETDTFPTTPKQKDDVCSVTIERNLISTRPKQKVDICAAAMETDHTSTIFTPIVNISAHLAGDCRDMNIQKNEIHDCSHIKVSEISPNINETNATPILENVAKIADSCFPHTLESNYLPIEANTSVSSDNEAPSDYTLEDALNLVRSYISELERVASNMERILQSDSLEVEINKNDDSNFKVSNSHIAFESSKETMGDNPVTVVRNINTELSDSLGDEAPTAPVKIVDVNEDCESVGKDFNNRNKECISENMSSMHDEVAVQCSERSDCANSALFCDQTNSHAATITANSNTRAGGSELPPHNVNNNNACYYNANIDNNSKTVLLHANADAKSQLLSKFRQMRSILSPVCTENLDVESHRHYYNLAATNRFGKEDTIYENRNNNGNKIRLAPRNITLSSEPGSSAITQNGTEEIRLKTRTQRLKNKLKTPGFDLLVFEGSKVYSIAQKAPNWEEIVEHKKQGGSGKHHVSNTISAVSSLRSCQSVNQFSESNCGLETPYEKSEENSHSVGEGHTSTFGTNSEKVPDALSLPCSEKVHSEPDTYLESSLGKVSQISGSESKPNYSLNVVENNFEMLKVDTPAEVECHNLAHECELEPMRNQAEQRQQNAKKSRNTRRSRSRTYLDNERQYRKEKNIKKYNMLDIVTSGQDGEMSTKCKTEQGSSSLPGICKHCWQSSAGLTVPVDNRWASALGSNENSSTDVNKIGYQMKQNFPIRIRTASKQNPKDAYIPARTRRLTVESPAENLLVHTSYDRPNPKQMESIINIEMANRGKVLYVGAEPDYIDTDGTRRLICETECFSCKDPKTKHLVIENNGSNVSYGKLNPVSEETKKRWENGITVAPEKITRGTSNELLDIPKNASDKSVKWYGAGCARMIGDSVVIGTSKSIRSVVNMVQSQMKYSITTGASNEAVNLPEAGDVDDNAPRNARDVDDNAPRNAAVSDQIRGGESGDHVPLAVTDGSLSNCNNNNVCLQDRSVGGNHKQRLHSKVKESVYSGNLGYMASGIDIAWCCPYITEPCIYRTWCCPCITEPGIDRTWCCPYITEPCMDSPRRCTNAMICCLTRTPRCSYIIPPSTNRAWSCTHKRNDNYTFVNQMNLILRSHTDINPCTIVIAIIYQFVYETIRIISCRLCSLLVSRSLAKTSSEPNRNNSSDRESNDWWEVNKMTPRLTNEASTETTDLNPDDVVFPQDCERKLPCSSCGRNHQMAYQNNHEKFAEFMTQVEATDINTDAESQTCEILVMPKKRLPSVRQSKGKMSLIDENIYPLQKKQTIYRTWKQCSSCCEENVYSVESENDEFETQVEATDINPSNLTQTGKSLISIDTVSTLQADIRKDLRAIFSETYLRPHLLTEMKPGRSSFPSRERRSSSSTGRESEHTPIVKVPSLPILRQSVSLEQLPVSYSYHVDVHHEAESADKDSDCIGALEGLGGLEIQEAGLIWHSSGSGIGMHGRHKSELEFFMPKSEVSKYYDQDFQSGTNPTHYSQSTVDHESGGYSIRSIPISRISLTVLDPTPVYDFTFTKGQWRPRYRHRILKGNINLEGSSETTVNDDEEPSTTVACKRRRSEDRILLSGAKDLPQQCPIRYY